MRRILIAVAVGLMVVLADAVVVLRGHDVGRRRSAPAASPTLPARQSTTAARRVFAGRLDDPALQCRDWGFVYPTARESPPPVPTTGDVIAADRVTAMTVCESDFAPPVSGSIDGVRQLPITDPALAATIVEAANRRRQPPPGACTSIAYTPSDTVLVRYGSDGVDQVGFSYGGCGLAIRSTLSERWDTRVAPGYLGTVIPINEAPITSLATRDAPCLLRIPAFGRGGRSSPAPFVATTTRSVTICRYRSADAKLVDQQPLDPAAFNKLQQWLTALPLTKANCSISSHPLHDVLLVSDSNRDLYPIDLDYNDCGAVHGTFSATRYGATPTTLEVLAPALNARTPP